MRLEPLGGGIEIYVSDRHHFTTDTILLAHFARVRDGERVTELGAGCGTIPMLLIREHAPRYIRALELSDEAVALLKDSVAHNLSRGYTRAGLIQPIPGDIRAVRELFEAGSEDLVICNPPYKLPGSGIVNPDPVKGSARHELSCSLDDVAAAAAWLLRFGGRLVMCQRPERLSDVLGTLRAHSLEPKRLRLVQGRADKAPKLFLIEAKRGAKPGYMDVEPTLVIEDEGGFTAEMRAIYGSYKDGHEDE